MKFGRRFLQNKKILIAGIQGSGKTYLARQLAKTMLTMVYTPHWGEWLNDKVVLIKTDDFVANFPLWCQIFKTSKCEMLVVDEADLLFTKHWETNNAVRDLVINHRHYGKSLVFVTRRPQDIPANLYGTFEILCLFSIESPQVIILLNRYYAGLGDMVKNLPYGSHQFVFKQIGGEPKVMIA